MKRTQKNSARDENAPIENDKNLVSHPPFEILTWEDLARAIIKWSSEDIPEYWGLTWEDVMRDMR